MEETFWILLANCPPGCAGYFVALLHSPVFRTPRGPLFFFLSFHLFLGFMAFYIMDRHSHIRFLYSYWTL